MLDKEGLSEIESNFFNIRMQSNVDKRDEFSAVAWKLWGIQHIYNIIISSSSTNTSTNNSNFYYLCSYLW